MKHPKYERVSEDVVRSMQDALLQGVLLKFLGVEGEPPIEAAMPLAKLSAICDDLLDERAARKESNANRGGVRGRR